MAKETPKTKLLGANDILAEDNHIVLDGHQVPYTNVRSVILNLNPDKSDEIAGAAVVVYQEDGKYSRISGLDEATRLELVFNKSASGKVEKLFKDMEDLKTQFGLNVNLKRTSLFQPTFQTVFFGP